MKSIIFYNTLKKFRSDERFEAIQKTFDDCYSTKSYANTPVPECDLAIIQGWMKKKSKGNHNVLREMVIETQFKRKKHVLTVDGNIFNYISNGVYFRYSIDGIFANTGYYFDNKVDPNRWKNIKTSLNCDLKPWRKNGDHVLILMQKGSGWTMGDKSNYEWCSETIQEIRKHTDRKIIVRLHPSDDKLKDAFDKLAINKQVLISQNLDIRQDLQNAWCSISHNSSPAVPSIIEGVPVFITDPDWKRSPVSSVGNIDMSTIEDPLMPVRTEWIEKMAMSHFSIDDIKNGLLWNGVKEYFENKEKK